MTDQPSADGSTRADPSSQAPDESPDDGPLTPLGALGQAVLDALVDRVAVVGVDGVIVAVNSRWRDVEFPAHRAEVSLEVGDHYVGRLEGLPGPNDDPVVRGYRAMAASVEDVLRGRRRSAQLEWPSPVGPGRWDVVQVVALPGNRGALVTARDVSDRVLAEARLQHAVSHDRLTGLANRTRLVSELDHLLAGGPPDPPVAIVHLDLDRFELLNARHGPAAADRVLAVVARRLSAAVPDSLVARAGDDSFVVVARCAKAECSALAERLLDTVSQPVVLDGQEVAVTASAGVAVSAPDTSHPEDLLRDADLAMHRAKEGGRAQVVMASAAGRAERARRLEVEQGLRGAVDRGELWLEYQPWVSLADGDIVGYEALVRWTHPTLGRLPPGAFIGVAEETGAIAAIGTWVLGTACRDASAWGTLDRRRVIVSVNVSPAQLADPGFPAMVAGCLVATGLAPTSLCLEVTESALATTWDVAERRLQEVRATGVLVAIDDFGTGYSSFAHLARLPADIVKTAPSLGAGVASDTQSQAVVEAVVALARRLGLLVVAEGVEHDHARARLQALGCDAAQGYACGRPVSPAAVAASLVVS